MRFRHAWALPFALGLIWSAISLQYLVRGRSLEPKAMRAVDEASEISPDLGRFVQALLRLVGLNWLASSLVAMTIAVTGLRRGERSAWYALWVLTAYWFGDSTIDLAVGGSGWRRGYAWAALWSIALLLCPQARALHLGRATQAVLE